MPIAIQSSENPRKSVSKEKERVDRARLGKENSAVINSADATQTCPNIPINGKMKILFPNSIELLKSLKCCSYCEWME